MNPIVTGQGKERLLDVGKYTNVGWVTLGHLARAEKTRAGKILAWTDRGWIVHHDPR